MAYYSGQGRVYIGTRNAAGNPLNLRYVGNVPDLKLTLTTDVIQHQESVSGQRLTDLHLIKAKKGDVAFSLEDFVADNLDMALYGATSAVAAGTVTGELLPATVTVGGSYLLAQQFVSAVVVTDSSGVPLTLPTTQYKVNANGGSIEFLDITAGGPYVQPFKVAYAYGAAHHTAMFATPLQEHWVRFEGLNTANSNAPVIVDLYRVAIDPTKNLNLIGDVLEKLPLTGQVMADLTKPDTGPLGVFGRVIMAG